MKDVKFFKKIIKNGMTVIFENRENSGVASIAFAVRHGGVNESEKEKGISHFIEHMLFKGTKNRTSKKISEDIEKNGGILNGFTEEEITAYWCKLPSNKLKIGLEVLSDMILNSLFKEEEMNKERKVILEEMKMRKDRPDSYVSDEIQSLLFDGNLGFNLIGTEESLNNIDRKKMLEKFQKIYGSENLICCVVGEANFEELCDFCEKKFKKSGFKIETPAVKNKNTTKIVKRKDIDQINMIFAYHVPKAGDKKSYSSQILNCVLSGGMSSRLFQEIREKRNLAYAVKGNSISGRLYGYNSIFVGTSPGNLEKVKNLILEEFKKVRKIEEKEIAQVKEQLIGNSKISREDSQGQMIDLLFNEIWTKAEDSYNYEENISKVKIEEVQDMANLENYSMIALVPAYSGEAK